jgi:hypothetical protein
MRAHGQRGYRSQVNAHLPQLARQLADVDVHPASIFAAQRRQRTCMIRDHRNSQHGVHQSLDVL